MSLGSSFDNWIIDYFELCREVLGSRYDNFQLIIVDNNIPPAVRSGFKIVPLKDDGLIRNLNNGTALPPPQRPELDEDAHDL